MLRICIAFTVCAVLIQKVDCRERMAEDCYTENKFVKQPSSPLKNRIQAIRTEDTGGAILVTWTTLEGADEYQVYYIPTGLMDVPASEGPRIKESCGGKERLAIITPDKLQADVSYSVYIRAERRGKYFALLSSVQVNALLSKD